MITSTEQLIEKIKISPYVKRNLKEKYELIKDRDLIWNEELRRLLNFICPNLTRVAKKPNTAWIDKSTGGGSTKDWERYNDAWLEYNFENSQGKFPYTEENHRKLVEWIKKEL